MTVRLRDGGGRPGPSAQPARVRLFTGLGAASLTSLLEDADGAPLPLVDGAAEAPVPIAGLVTLALAALEGDGLTDAGPPGVTGPQASRMACFRVSYAQRASFESSLRSK